MKGTFLLQNEYTVMICRKQKIILILMPYL